MFQQQVVAIWQLTRQKSLPLPDNLRAEVEKVARAQQRTVSEVLADAVDRYLKDDQWRSLKTYGREQARARGIQEDDVLRLIAESRLEHKQGRLSTDVTVERRLLSNLSWLGTHDFQHGPVTTGLQGGNRDFT